MAEKAKRIIYKGEIVWYSIFGAIWLFGFVLGILGICAYNVGKLSTNPLYKAQQNLASFFNVEGIIDFRIVGTIIMLIAMVLFLIVIYVYSTKANERMAAERRAQERRRILFEDEGINSSKTTEQK